MKDFIKMHREIIMVCLISLIVRLIIMPYAQSTDADAASRVFIARNLLGDFQLLMSGYWAPIHHYFNAFSLLIVPGNIYGPKILSMLFAVASCIPLYFFTKNEFNKQGALFVALIYTFSPVVFKNSFLAMAEVCYAFFILLSMYFLSKGFRSQQKARYAIYAGLSITVAGGVRFEAWEVMALFFLVLLLLKQWRMVIPFTLTALIFPVYWMIGSQIEQKDFLYSFHSVTNYVTSFGYNENVTEAEHVKRLLFFPISWFMMLTPFISIILLFTFLKRLISRNIDRAKLIWFIPFLSIMITYIYTAYNGTLVAQHRFSITLILLSVPFFALFFEHERHLKLKRTMVFIIISLMIPLSFCWPKMPIYKIRKYSPSLFSALEYSLINEKNDAIPLIGDESTEALSCSINFQMTGKKGLLLDFIGWDKTFYIALNTGQSINNIYIIDAVTQKINPEVLNKFIKDHPEGLFMIKAFSPFDKVCHSIGSVMEIEEVPYFFYLEKCLDVNNVKLFKYFVKSKEWAENYKSYNSKMPGITSTVKDVEYYENVIRESKEWYDGIKKDANKNNLPIDEVLRSNAKFMVEQDSINSKKDSILR